MVFKKGQISTFKGKKHTLEAKIKMSNSHKGHIPWNKGKKLHYRVWNKGKKGYKSIGAGFKKGHIPWNKGISRREETKRKISLIHKGKRYSPNTEFKKGHIPWIKGKRGFKPWNKGIGSPCNYNWSFVTTIRNKILKRDNYTCNMCNCFGKDVHHINGIKKDDRLNNLEVLCRKCHSTLSNEIMRLGAKKWN